MRGRGSRSAYLRFPGKRHERRTLKHTVHPQRRRRLTAVGHDLVLFEHVVLLAQFVTGPRPRRKHRRLHRSSCDSPDADTGAHSLSLEKLDALDHRAPDDFGARAITSATRPPPLPVTCLLSVRCSVVPRSKDAHGVSFDTGMALCCRLHAEPVDLLSPRAFLRRLLSLLSPRISLLLGDCARPLAASSLLRSSVERARVRSLVCTGLPFDVFFFHKLAT